MGALDDDGLDVDMYDIDFCGTASTGLTIDDDGGANIVNVDLDTNCESE